MANFQLRARKNKKSEGSEVPGSGLKVNEEKVILNETFVFKDFEIKIA
jgi:hypothetical protein